ncbi:PLP-dependent aminotransferase family protein [Achromobacter piechaudii]|uniref:Transcriptional regulator, GntR family n=1 Tax=Achromobacter piechaudii ATCC 43553 TaxID=742159 RepID=D4X4L1_9BURK|nr:PLP-dependent aminotransferase family protein [Achromobacter piechaudii]EFF78183.1 transcriptional regulator, GntR family [Achromobacter piechaudii ATCC 43553]
MSLYETLADEIAKSIRDGVMRVGDKLPSVRDACAARGVSPSTVFQAYYLLEARGLIRARPRSGYYVHAPVESLPPEPGASNPAGESTELAISERIFDILGSVRNRDVTPLGSAFPSPLLFPLPRLAQAMAAHLKRQDPLDTVEDLSPGNPSLRRQIALRYLIGGMNVAASDIVVTNGALEALNLCLQAVTQVGDTVMVEAPTFYGALQALERQGLKALEVPTHPRTGVDLDAMEAAIKRHAPRACWLMTQFQNPLGSLMPDDKKRQLVEMLARHGIPLIEDDVYGELYYGAARPVPAKAYDKAGLVLHCSSFSKCLAPGYRIGWVSAGRYTQRVQRLKLSSTLSASGPAQGAIAEYLEQGGYDRHLRRLRQTLQAQQDRMADAIAHEFPAGTRVTRPQGGFFLWVELPAAVDALGLHRDALARGVSVAPGPIFSASSQFASALRLNYGHPWDAAHESAIRVLGELARQACARAKGRR